MFASNPADFEFTGGNRKLIKSTAAHVKNIFQYFGDIEGMKLFMRKAIKETESMKVEETDNDNKAPLTQTHYFLNKLLETANCNSVRKGKNGFRYDDEIKLYATFIRMLAGRFAYETIQANLPYSLPSLPSTNRYIQKTVCNVIEGFLRCKELAEYLDERGTRIEGRVQYDSSTNQITGFVLPIDNNGMPIPQQYPARNAELKTTKVKSFSSFLHLPVKTSQVIDLMNVDLKDYKDKVKEVSETSPYVKLIKNGKLFIVKKTTLCWLLRKDYCKISSDRLKRVQMKEDTQKQIKKNCLYSYKPLKKRKSNKK